MWLLGTREEGGGVRGGTEGAGRSHSTHLKHGGGDGTDEGAGGPCPGEVRYETGELKEM